MAPRKGMCCCLAGVQVAAQFAKQWIAIHLRYLLPLQAGIQEIMQSFNHILVVELNDRGVYGYGQLGGIMRAMYCDPRIRGINKTDGLPFKVREILDQLHQRLPAVNTAGMD